VHGDPRSFVAWLVGAAVLIGSGRHAAAYRPFDQTDGDTAEVNTIELEIGPTQVTRENGQFVSTPTGVFNYGFSAGWEIVVDLDGTLPWSDAGTHVLQSDFLVKHVLRKGCLQDKTGPSIALETGVLFPTLPQLDDEAGWSADLIVSQIVGPITIHANGFVEATRDRQFLYTGGAIIEGPHDWKVRPVGEFYAGQNNGQLLDSFLVGAIWTFREHVVFDAAIRHGTEATVAQNELRIGVTWVIQL
jgi:hypothetical protein